MKSTLAVIFLLGIEAMSRRIHLKQRSSPTDRESGRSLIKKIPTISYRSERKLTGTTKADLCTLASSRWENST